MNNKIEMIFSSNHANALLESYARSEHYFVSALASTDLLTMIL